MNKNFNFYIQRNLEPESITLLKKRTTNFILSLLLSIALSWFAMVTVDELRNHLIKILMLGGASFIIFLAVLNLITGYDKNRQVNIIPLRLIKKVLDEYSAIFLQERIDSDKILNFVKMFDENYPHLRLIEALDIKKIPDDGGVLSYKKPKAKRTLKVKDHDDLNLFISDIISHIRESGQDHHFSGFYLCSSDICKDYSSDKAFEISYREYFEKYGEFKTFIEVILNQNIANLQSIMKNADKEQLTNLINMLVSLELILDGFLYQKYSNSPYTLIEKQLNGYYQLRYKEIEDPHVIGTSRDYSLALKMLDENFLKYVLKKIKIGELVRYPEIDKRSWLKETAILKAGSIYAISKD